jgi:hypothetical protein
MIYKYSEFITERYNKVTEYLVGDVVMIRYWLTGDITPVKIIEKISHNNYIVSFKVEGSHLFNANDLAIKLSDIIGKQTEPLQTLTDPKINPVTTNIVPTVNVRSNDISI